MRDRELASTRLWLSLALFRNSCSCLCSRFCFLFPVPRSFPTTYPSVLVPHLFFLLFSFVISVFEKKRFLMWKFAIQPQQIPSNSFADPADLSDLFPFSKFQIYSLSSFFVQLLKFHINHLINFSSRSFQYQRIFSYLNVKTQ